jgi:hypothetical protein
MGGAGILHVQSVMFSMPLAYPSTLDRRFHVAERRPTWGSFGARCPACRLEKRTLKLTLIRPMHFQRAAAEIFLSQAGPRFDSELFQAEHHLLFDILGRLSDEKGDPVWVALVWLASAAKDLAQEAPSEGYDVAGPANRIAAMQARQGRHGDGRFGDK